MICHCLVLLLSINSDATIWADDGARRTANACVRYSCLYIAITMHIDLLLGQCDDLMRTSLYAERASLATLGIDYNSPFNLAHILIFFLIIFTFGVAKAAAVHIEHYGL